MEKRWVLKEEPDEVEVEELRKAINVNHVLSSILVQRGIKTYDSAKAYFRPSLNDLHDPFLMKDMSKAVERLGLAIDSREKILVYGDYDVDGTTSVALVYNFLKPLAQKIDFYLPDRYTEGYGISKKGIEYAIANEVRLIIALDCGIRANDQIKRAKDANIDVIICDHHIPGEKLPAATAILDPKQAECSYPYKELSGCGIGFKLLQGYCIQKNIPSNDLFDHLDLVAVSIAADIVPITDENRILTYFGLRRLNESPGHGLRALARKAGLVSEMEVSHVVFGIAPRINAAGRINHANDAVRLLLSESEEEAMELSATVQDQNLERRNIDEATTKEALEMLENDLEFAKARSTVIFNPDWHKGVIGIVASRLIENYYRPTIVLTKSNGMATGSARSIRGFNIYGAISQCMDLLDQFGGHAYAAGLTLPIENITEFRQRFDEIVKAEVSDDQLIPEIVIDQQIDFERIDHKFFNILNQMAPFGPENPSPVFLTKGVRCSSAKVLKDEHLKLWLRQETSKRTMEAIAFRMSAYHSAITKGSAFDIVYHIESNEFNGEKSIQLVIKDIKFAS